MGESSFIYGYKSTQTGAQACIYRSSKNENRALPRAREIEYRVEKWNNYQLFYISL